MKGKKVLVTRAEGDNKAFKESLQKKGAVVFELPMVRFRPVEELTQIHTYLNQLETIDWVVFTSSKTVEFFFDIAHSAKVKFHFYPHLKIATVGEKTKLTLEQLGYRTNFVPIKYTAEVLAENMDENIAGKRILIPRSNKATNEYIEVFTKRGAKPLPVTVYLNEALHYNSVELKKMLNEKLDYLTFASGSAYEAFYHNLQKNNLKLTTERKVCIGPSTAKVVEASGEKADAIAEHHTVEGLIQAIENLE